MKLMLAPEEAVDRGGRTIKSLAYLKHFMWEQIDKENPHNKQKLFTRIRKTECKSRSYLPAQTRESYISYLSFPQNITALALSMGDGKHAGK